MVGLAMSNPVPEKIVLIVDDNEQWANCLKEYFELNDYEAHVAENGAVGLKLLAECQPSLILTDMIMPETEGFEFISAVRRNDKNIPIIAMSGGMVGRADYYLDVAKKIGANKCLDKPFSWQTLNETLTEVLDN
jgi:DNA-binding response OmpR family regulator